MPLPTKKPRTDNPFTTDDEPERPNPTHEEAILREGEGDAERPAEKVLPVDPPDDDDNDPAEGRGPTPRQQKRKARYDQLQADKDASDARAREAEQLVAAMRAQALTRPATDTKATDPFDAEDKAIEADWRKHLELADTLAKGATPEQQKQWKDDYLGLLRRQQTAVTKRALAESGIVHGQKVNIDEEVTKAFVRSTFPDIVANPRALQYADGVLRQKLAREGRAGGPSLQDYDEALKQTRRDLRMPGASAAPPSDETRRKFSGNGLNGASGTANGNREIRMSPDDMAIAEAMYKEERDPKTGKKRRLTEAESHAKWAQKIGKKVLANNG